MTGRVVSAAISRFFFGAVVLGAAWSSLSERAAAQSQERRVQPSARSSDVAEAPAPAPPAPSAADVVLGAVNEVVDRLNVHVHGFASQGFIYSIDNNYLMRSRSGSFELSEAAVNVTSNPIDELRIGVQLFARDLGAIGNYDMKLDWFYVDYRFADWLGIRAGRTKIPFGLYNELNDVDVARVPILLPQSTYPTTNRDFLLAQTGGEIYGRVPLDLLGALEYRIYAGTVFIEIPNYNPLNTYNFTSVVVPYIMGSRVVWETPIEGLRLAGSAQVLKANFSVVGPMNAPEYYTLFGALWMASLEYTRDDLLIAAEYSRWHTEASSSIPIGNSIAAAERAYAMLNYRVADWFHPGAYYSVAYGNVDIREGRAAQLHDVALTLRFDITDNWLVKLEGHYMHGTAGLSAALNGGIPPRSLAENWAVFLLKTTGYF